MMVDLMMMVVMRDIVNVIRDMIIYIVVTDFEVIVRVKGIMEGVVATTLLFHCRRG